MPIVEYKLELTSDGKKKPEWVIVGGKFKSPLNHSMIGYVAPKDRRDYYVCLLYTSPSPRDRG